MEVTIEVDMATAHENIKVKLEDIDLVLRDAEVYNIQLQFLHYGLSFNVDERKRLQIESKCATIFRDMMSNLYSVLDQIYYFLYCHFQNKGEVSFSSTAFKIKQPIKQDLKWSEGDTRDELKRRRNQWFTHHWETIFRGVKFPESKRHDIRRFQNNLLELQAIRKVDNSGKEVPGEPTLLHVVDIKHDAKGNLLHFNPSITVVELKSVADTPWNDTIKFNLLHFFRNFTAHRSLIACKTKTGYFNVETGKFEPADPNSSLPKPWIFHQKGSLILVPELSHLRQKGRESSPTFHPQPLIFVCHSLLNFVKIQRREMLLVLDKEEDYPYRFKVRRTGSGLVEIQKGDFRTKCRWEVAHLWPVIRTIKTGSHIRRHTR